MHVDSGFHSLISLLYMYITNCLNGLMNISKAVPFTLLIRYFLVNTLIFH